MENIDNTIQAVIRDIFKNWKKFLFQVLFISLLAVVVSLFFVFYYQSEARLTAAEVESAPSGSSSFISSLPAGLGTPDLNDSIIEAREIISSRDFFKRLLQYDGIYQGLLDPYSYDTDDAEAPIKDPSIALDIEMDSRFYDAMNTFSRALEFEDVLEYDYFTIRYTHYNPKFCKHILDIIIKELNLQKKDKDINEANKAISFLTTRILDVSNAEVRGSISRLIESQLKREMIANMRDEYLVSIVDSPALPIVKAGPKRLLIFLISFISSIIVLIPIYAYRQNRIQ